jgi:hypothetical protein
VSTDGYRWARVADASPRWSEGGGRLHSVVAAGSSVVAVGDAPYAWGYSVMAVWYSADGHTWARYPDPEGTLGPIEECREPGEPGWEPNMDCSLGIKALTVGGRGLVAVGYDSSRGDLAAAVWVAAPPDR